MPSATSPVYEFYGWDIMAQQKFEECLFGDIRVASLLFAVDVVLLASLGT